MSTTAAHDLRFPPKWPGDHWSKGAEPNGSVDRKMFQPRVKRGHTCDDFVSKGGGAAVGSCNKEKSRSLNMSKHLQDAQVVIREMFPKELSRGLKPG